LKSSNEYEKHYKLAYHIFVISARSAKIDHIIIF